MTNVPSGSKRPWEGSNGTDSYKRARDDPSGKDWRDVHLKPPRDGRRSSADRRRDERSTRRHSRSREYDHYRRSSDYGRDRDRRDDRDRERKQDREKERDRERYRERARQVSVREDSLKNSERRSPVTPRHPSSANGTSQTQGESEKEEGE
jgi:serine/threonine-protein kinase PRP4